VIATSSNKEKARTAPWFGQVEYIPFDLSHLDPQVDYHRFFGQPDRMIHLAWEGLPNYKEPFHLEVNYPRHTALLKNMIEHGLADLTVTGTCFEYGMREGRLSEDMPAAPDNAYARAKDDVRKYVAALQAETAFHFKWVRLFYMYGKGQNQKSLLSQLDKALDNGDAVFNMSGGEQERDYLPVEAVATNIVKIALQNKTEGIINCCSGRPVTVKAFVQDYLRKKNRQMALNLGYYPYPDYEAMRFWGDNKKLQQITS